MPATVVHAPAGSRWYLTTAHEVVLVPTITATTTTSTTSSGAIWTDWNETATTITTNAIWAGWVGMARARGRAEAEAIISELRAMRTPEQNEAARAEARAVAQQMSAERAAAQAVRNAAREKARALLLAQLTDRQRIDLASNGYFELETIQPSGERRRYRIRRGRSRNVDRIDEQGRRLFTLCAHPAIDCPDEDTMLTQKLWIERNEEQFLRLANVS